MYLHEPSLRARNVESRKVRFVDVKLLKEHFVYIRGRASLALVSSCHVTCLLPNAAPHPYAPDIAQEI
jgi:hypothetical protein